MYCVYDCEWHLTSIHLKDVSNSWHSWSWFIILSTPHHKWIIYLGCYTLLKLPYDSFLDTEASFHSKYNSCFETLMHISFQYRYSSNHRISFNTSEILGNPHFAWKAERISNTEVVIGVWLTELNKLKLITHQA